MLYRTFPKIPDKSISVLGFGMMRLPLIQGKNRDDSAVDEKEAEKLVRIAYEQGVNYYDTAYIYHGGKSEEILGRILRRLNIRNKVYIADKMPVWPVKEKADWEKLFNTQLKRLGTDYIDFYLMHSLNDKSWQTIQKLNGLDFLEKMKKEGKIRHIGFSFHHEPETFRSIIDGYENWEFCQIQYNYLDEQYQAGTAGLKYAYDKGIGAVSMEPLRGGVLARVPQAVTDIFAHANVPRLPAEWGLRWVWEHQEITLALSGMGSAEQVLTNCATASAAKPNSLPASQMRVIEKAAAWFKSRIKVPCTACAYCTPCPAGVSIPDIFSAYNAVSMQGAFENGGTKAFSTKYRSIQDAQRGANKCVRCGACEPRCPQHIRIPDMLAQAHKAME
ncbi:aldo/keto reductase [Treponema sp. OMZ 840]|uniref:aldo/keto reductase n=1 Tax=Treponema sp. OMZ 840 TaxID=244313 RepID=UPI003D8EBF6E